MAEKFFIIDFDSTFTQVEAFEELAAISLKSNPKKGRNSEQDRRDNQARDGRQNPD